jgi:type IV secretion system protein VirB10
MTLFARPNEARVAGERGVPLITRALSIQSRVSNLLAMGLMLAIGIVFLGWYYMHIATRSARARATSSGALSDKSHSEMPLPSLGKLDAPLIAEVPQPSAVVLAPRAPEVVLSAPTATPSTQPSAMQRRLSGVAFAAGGSPSSGAADPQGLVSLPATVAGSAAVAAVPDALSALLSTDSARMASARLMPSQRLLLPKGAFVDCTLETAIDSTLPGLTTCVTATDTYGADGSVVLLERGTKLLGETRGQIQQASARVFVVWTEARTPKGVVVPLDSPGADELGRSGLPGQVERHFWERFGAAILISTIDGGVQAAVQSTNKGTGTLIYNPSGAQDVMGEVLKSTLNIAPTVIKQNGDRIQILVARDIDFSRVYELRHVADRP